MNLIEDQCDDPTVHYPHPRFTNGPSSYVCPGRTCPAPPPVRAEEPKPIDRVIALAERAGCEPWQVELVVQTVMSQPEAWGI